VLRPLAAVADPLERVFALLDAYRQRLVATGCRYGCPLGRLALELDPENEPAHRLIAANFTAWKAAVERDLRAAGVPQPAAAADLVLTVMEGAVLQARAYRSTAPFDACVAQLRAHLEGLRKRKTANVRPTTAKRRARR
jgi:AcrR family transcriptional regulator